MLLKIDFQTIFWQTIPGTNASEIVPFYKKRKTKRFRQSKKAQQNMNLDIEQISCGSYKQIKRRIKRKKTNRFNTKFQKSNILIINRK